MIQDVTAQLQLVRYDSIPVSRNGDTLGLAWAGGFNSPQFSSIDLNGDGVKDLFAFERDFYGMPKTFVNNGTAGKVDYTYAPFYQHGFPQMRNWALLADYNCDGKADIFTNVPFGVAVYRNDYSSEKGLKFIQVSALLQSSTENGLEPLYVSPPDIPSIVDIDNDGDLDILTFDIIGKYVEFHKNLSDELNGDCTTLEYELNSKCWGYFSENETNNGITLYDTCGQSGVTMQLGERHAGSALLALNMNGDAQQDLLVGDIAHNNLVGLINGGTVQEASMLAIDSTFPAYDIPTALTVFPAAFHVDVNNDNIRDLLVSPNNPNTSENFNNIWYYENKAHDDSANFVLQTTSFMQNEMIDVGAGARPVFFDCNADGLLDIVIGNYGYFVESGVYASKLALYENTGSLYSPAFRFVTDDYSNLSALNQKGIYPVFGDLDGDGIQEMITGNEGGQLNLYINQAPKDQAAEFILAALNYKDIDVGETSMPQIIDVNRDGLLDLLVGERSGTINYFENIGSQDQADFTSQPTNDMFGGIDVMLECCAGYSSPFLMEDSVGNYMLYIGSEKGYLYLYNDIEGNLDGDFQLIDSLNLYGLQVTISGADINNSGDVELIYGEYAGGISMLKSGKPEFLGTNKIKGEPFKVHVYPNPVNNVLHIQIQTANADKSYKVELIDLYGKIVDTRYFEKGNHFTIPVNSLQHGIYLVRISSENYILTRKIIAN